MRSWRFVLHPVSRLPPLQEVGATISSDLSNERFQGYECAVSTFEINFGVEPLHFFGRQRVISDSWTLNYFSSYRKDVVCASSCPYHTFSRSVEDLTKVLNKSHLSQRTLSVVRADPDSSSAR